MFTSIALEWMDIERIYDDAKVVVDPDTEDVDDMNQPTTTITTVVVYKLTKKLASTAT